MTASGSRRLAVTLVVAAVALAPIGVALNLLAVGVPLPRGRGDMLFLGGVLSVFACIFTPLGALVVWRQPRNAVGWLLLAIGVAVAVQSVAYGYADLALYGDRAPMPGGVLAGWLGNWLFTSAVFVAPCFLILLFPDGHPPSPAWRRPLIALGAVVAFGMVTLAVQDGDLTTYPGVENPLGIGGRYLASLEVLDLVVPPLLLLSAGASIVRRFRRAAGRERQQLKLVAYAASLATGCFAVAFPADAVATILSDSFFLLGLLGIALLPVAAGVAIARHRLYDIDVVINRTLVYALVTASLVGLYLLGVLVLGALVRPVTGESDLAVAASTLLVAGLFRPVRARIQRGVDHRFYRRKYDAERTLEGFGSRLRDEVDLQALAAALRETVERTVQPAVAGVWLLETATPSIRETA